LQGLEEIMKNKDYGYVVRSFNSDLTDVLAAGLKSFLPWFPSPSRSTNMPSMVGGRFVGLKSLAVKLVRVLRALSWVFKCA